MNNRYWRAATAVVSTIPEIDQLTAPAIGMVIGDLVSHWEADDGHAWSVLTADDMTEAAKNIARSIVQMHAEWGVER